MSMTNAPPLYHPTSALTLLFSFLLANLAYDGVVMVHATKEMRAKRSYDAKRGTNSTMAGQRLGVR